MQSEVYNKQKEIQDLVANKVNNESIRKAQAELERLVGGSNNKSGNQFRQMIFRKSS